jgi:bifunctional N-acetylglucosamine-1-phosphate-uridyltransferase/glucosamine-1-phosphate-acetyltransferase GlmU-like protein
VGINEKCWPGYKQVGLKKKGDRMVPNCVKEVDEEQQRKERIALKKGMYQAKQSLMQFKKFYEQLPDEGTDDAVKLAKQITPGEN